MLRPARTSWDPWRRHCFSGFRPRQYWASWPSGKDATPTNPPTVTAKAIGVGLRRQFLDCVAWIRQQTAATTRFSQINSPTTDTIAVAKAPSTSRLNITKASRRALSNNFRGCPLRSLPAPGLCAAIHAATVLPCVTCASAVLRVARSSWIAASHNACSSGGNSLDARGNKRRASSARACRSNRESGPATCLVNKAAFAVATLGKFDPLRRPGVTFT